MVQACSRQHIGHLPGVANHRDHRGRQGGSSLLEDDLGGGESGQLLVNWHDGDACRGYVPGPGAGADGLPQHFHGDRDGRCGASRLRPPPRRLGSPGPIPAIR